MRQLIIATLLIGLAGCSGRYHRGDEAMAISEPNPALGLKGGLPQIYGKVTFDADSRPIWIPVGTRVRVASEERDGRVMALVLEGEHKDETIVLQTFQLGR